MAQPRNRHLRVCAALTAVWLISVSAHAAGDKSSGGMAVGPGAIRWKSGAATVAAPAAVESQGAIDDGGTHRVVQLQTVPNADGRAELQARGIHLLRYLGNNAFLARVEPTEDQGGTPRDQDAVAASIVAMERTWKLHPRLASGDIPDHARAGRPAVKGRLQPEGDIHPPKADILALYVIFHADVDLATEGIAAVKRHGGQVRSLIHSINGAVVWLPLEHLYNLADEDAVQWLEPPLPPFEPVNNQNRVITQADKVQAAPYELTGDGVNVMVYDGGYADASHPDFGGRLTVRDSSGLSTHATHVAGTVGGSGAASGDLYRGMAPGVTIQSYGFEVDGDLEPGFLYTDPGDLEADYNAAINYYGAVIANNSISSNIAPNGYNCAWEGDYGATSMLIDAIVRGSLGTPMRIVWANGNERGAVIQCGSGYPYATTPPPSCAKNHITVGAINANDESMTSFSSYGPADDGRLKPDVTAPGCELGGDGGVTSTFPGGGYGSFCGTSMSAPTVTGLCALILEDYESLYPERQLPRNSTLKVLLAHNADDLGNIGPDYRFGYGSVRIRDTIDFLRGGDFVEDVIDHDEQRFYFVHVPPGMNELKVTTAWDDPPGAVNTIPELVNNLDIQVLSPVSGITHYPWTLDPANPDQPAVRTGPDDINNIEQVLVDNPESGKWLVRIRGTTVPQGPQLFSMAASPALQVCSGKGSIDFAHARYGCESTATVRVNDCDLDTDVELIETVSVEVSSDSEPGGETLLLTETKPYSATFEATIPLSGTDAAGTLLVAPDGLITATYEDADDGTGTPATVQASAGVDCTAPVISGVTVADLAPTRATIAFNTDEPTDAAVRVGIHCASLDLVAQSISMTEDHALTVADLQPKTAYYYAVEAVDEAGNLTFDDNGGSCRAFTTPDRPDYFSELFVQEFDLDGSALTLTPSGTADYYQACLETIGSLPTDPVGGTELSLSDDGSVQISLSGGQTLSFYGQTYSVFYVNANGSLTFNAPDPDLTYLESFPIHFDKARVSVMFDDFNPQAGGSVTWQQLADRVVVTWIEVPEYSTSNSNTFQVELFFDESIRLAWLGMDSTDGLVGLSEGDGVPEGFVESDLSSYCPCDTGDPAGSPSPTDGASGVEPQVVLTWVPGSQAESHDVYFGTTSDALEFQSNQTEASWAPPASLERYATYFWRIDERVCGAVVPGNTWSFTIEGVGPDFDNDGDVDLDDYAHLQECYTGSGEPSTDPTCKDARLDADNDVDQSDFDLFQGCLSGSEVLVAINCVD